ncbi:MAG: adenylate/guanylate cyclase domain-containing protein [Candidatus Nanohaloarchaea archaeon]|nr:adenylate/guanylate cyclase domain-containing protein [Candidatus Nanohaloarchaea archaeon]
MSLLQNRTFLCFTVAVASAAIASLVFMSGAGAETLASVSDTLYHKKPAPEEIVVIEIDDRSLQEIGRWPWDREVFAEAIRKLNQSRVIGIDISFFEKSTEEDDKALSSSLESSEVVMASEYSFKDGLNHLKPIFNTSYGHVNLIPGKDGIVRSIPSHINGTPSFALKIAQEVEQRPIAVPSNFRIPFYRDPPKISFHEMLNNRSRSFFRDRTVLIGITAPDLHDTYRTPVAKQDKMPGVLIHANILNSILERDFLFSQTRESTILYIIALAMICGLLFRLMPTKYAFFSSILLGLSYVGLSRYMFTRGIVYDLSYPLLSLSLTAIGSTLGLHTAEVLNRKWMADAFGKYVSEDVLEEVLEETEKGREIGLEGVTRDITILFADIRGFTSFSEGRPPEEVVEKLNESLQQITDSILNYSGTVDKYIGDEVMAFWNAPVDQEDHALKAVKSAVEMMENRETELEYGVGINTGEAVTGNIGSSERLEYTAIGDNVNVAARLCDMAEPGQILITKETKEGLDGRFDVKHHGSIQVKGRERPVEIYEVQVEK